ncbi:Nitrite reductase OS=Streptomyces alboniger OX=132473 GN=CP975_11080 PE=4 SV=1 [Streptomyces alboniger]
MEKGFPTDPEEVFEELRRASAGGPADYSGITYRRLAEENGVFWPCPATDGDGDGNSSGDGDVSGVASDAPDASPDAVAASPRSPGSGDAAPGDNALGGPHPGTPRLFLDRFATPDGRARSVAVSHRAIAEEPDDEYPVLLTTGRVVAQYQSGAQTRRVDELNAAAPGPFVELHPRLAERLGAVEGDPVAVVSRRGRAVAPARITTTIRPDTVFMPFHWPGEGRANTLTNPALDPTSRMPEFKACAVRLEAVES